MTPEALDSITRPFFSNGLIGSVCVVLGFIVVKLWSTHKAEIAAKDALIKELYDARIVDAKVGYDIARANEKTLEAFLSALNGRSH